MNNWRCKVCAKNFKPRISKDPNDMSNELFLLYNAGDDLIEAITTCMNKIKNQQKFPDCNATN